MDPMNYAEVAVDAPIGYDRTLSYSIPPGLSLAPGDLVWVPLGRRPVQGIVFELTQDPQVDYTRDIIATVEPSPLVDPLSLELAHWISGYYMSSLFDAASLMLPPGFETRVRSYIRAARVGGSPVAATSTKEYEALQLLADRGEMSEPELVKALGKEGDRELRRLLRREILERRWELPRPRVSYRYNCYVRSVGKNGQEEASERLHSDRAPRQMALYQALTASGQMMSLSVANKEYGSGAVSGLVAKGLLALEWTRVERKHTLQSGQEAKEQIRVVLNSDQQRAVEQLVAALGNKVSVPARFLIHGVTGSGKTEVYLRALEHCVRNGGKGIFLVPEIALTPQTLHRVNARFPGRVAVIHSRLSIGEQFEQWWKIKDRDCDVVVGPRSALFTPLSDLGLIVMDEEHEWTYKQQDASPRYHAREVALKLAELSGATVVLGSATPDVETYYAAKHSDYTLLELPRRIPVSIGPVSRPAELAQVEVCDMRQELKTGNRSIFSRALSTGLRQCTDSGGQAILFLNRRGAATVVQCRDCGYALRCRRCSVALTYHAADARLLCHQCNRRSSIPRGCPQCRSPRIRYLGLGTQRVVEELNRLLPHVTVARWDSDTARSAHAHERIMERFGRAEAQVLIGTQMVAKGLHVPNVTLVGVVLADIGLNLPDFRASERVFQLLCQVAGRAGRGASPGRVIIQTYDPTSYAVKAASQQNFQLLYNKELGHRQQHANPPFNQLVHMLYRHTSSQTCQREAQRMGRVLRQKVSSLGLTNMQVIGPAPGFPERVRGSYTWHLILRGRSLQAFLEGVAIPHGWTVDVDPVTLL